jgi:hypothetical protein
MDLILLAGGKALTGTTTRETTKAREKHWDPDRERRQTGCNNTSRSELKSVWNGINSNTQMWMEDYGVRGKGSKLNIR